MAKKKHHVAKRSYSVKRKHSRRRRGLSAGMGGKIANPAISGLISRGAVMLTRKFAPAGMQGELTEAAAVALAGFLAGKVMKNPKLGEIGLGIAVFVGTAKIPGLSEDNTEVEFVESDLNEGDPYALSAGNPYALSAGDPAFNQVYPGYINPGFYESAMDTEAEELN